MKILEQKDNFLTNRKEVKVVVKAEKNPTYDQAYEVLVKEFNVDKDLIVIKQVKGKFGRTTFLITAFIYNSKEDKVNFEPNKKEKKKEGDEAAPATPAPAAQPAGEEKKSEEKKEEAKPAEEKKEEKPVEEKKPAEEEKKQE